MKTKKLSLPLLGLGLALALAQPAVADVEVPEAADTVQTEQVTVRVENRNWLDMRVYAIVNNFAHRLGTVGSFATEEFELRKGWVGPSSEVQLVALPIGSRSAHYSEAVLAFPGDLLEYRIENSLGLSFLARR